MRFLQFEENELSLALRIKNWTGARRIIEINSELVNTEDENGNTPLVLAVQELDPSCRAPEDLVVAMLNKATVACIKYKFSIVGSSIIHLLSRIGYASALHHALKKTATIINNQDEWGQNAMHWCLLTEDLTFQQHKQTASILMQYGLSIRERDKNERTPLDLYMKNECVNYNEATKTQDKNELVKFLRGESLINNNYDETPKTRDKKESVKYLGETSVFRERKRLPTPVTGDSMSFSYEPKIKKKKEQPTADEIVTATKTQKKEFRDFLFELSKHYKDKKYKWLRFCLYGFLPNGELSNCNNKALDLFNELHNKGSISLFDINLLSDIAELTELMNAKGTVRNYRKNEYVERKSNGESLSAHRRGLFKALRNIGDNELHEVISNYPDFDLANNIWDVVFELETQLCLDEQNINSFLKCLKPATQRCYRECFGTQSGIPSTSSG